MPIPPLPQSPCSPSSDPSELEGLRAQVAELKAQLAWEREIRSVALEQAHDRWKKEQTAKAVREMER